MASQWGRKETVVWPPHKPIYSIAAVVFGLFATGLFLYCRVNFGQTAIQTAYTPDYIKAAAGSAFNRHDKFRLIQAAGDGSMTRGPVLLYDDKAMYSYLRAQIFEGNTICEIYTTPALFGLLALLVMFPLAVHKDIVRRKELKYGRRLKGPALMGPKAFNVTVSGDGMGFKTSELADLMRIPAQAEAQHFEIIGDTGSGKTTLIKQMLLQIQERNESAIIHDPACEFVKLFYDPKRGDIILNPLDDRSPYWGPSEELRKKAEAKAIAASLYQPTSDKKGEFFTETPQKIFAHLLTFGPSPQQLIEWMSDPKEIDRRVKGTELASILAPGAQQQRSGVLASLGLIADSLRMLPTREQAKSTWSATEWAEKREGWIFITSQPTEREALRPLQSLWIDLLVMRLLSVPKEGQRKVWFVLDELASLQRLPQLHTAITENRKSKNPLVLGFQGKAQLESIYGHMAEVMLSQPATKIFLKTTEPKAAEWVSKAIGQVEIERVKETHSDGARGHKTFAMDRQVESLVMDSEISGLADRHAFLKLGNNVARFSFAYKDLPDIAPDFIPRIIHDDELSFDPKTLQPKLPASPMPPAVPRVEPGAVDLEASPTIPTQLILGSSLF